MPPLVLLLALYPVVFMAAPIVFHSFWQKKGTHTIARSSEANTFTETGIEATVRLGALMALWMYGGLICGTLFWQALFSTNTFKTNLLTNSWLSSVLIGGYFGVSWAGVSIWLLALGSATGRMRREIPGLMAPLKLQIPVWLMGALAEEVWRVTTVAAFVSAQDSPLFSVVITGIAFGSAYLSRSLQRAAVACLEGVFLGFLFLWRGSLLAPFTAHLAVEAVYLWGVGQMPMDRQSRKTWQIPGTKCPICNAHLKLLQIKLSEAFECPSCKESLSLSDTYRNIMRFTAAFGFASLFICTFSLLVHWLPGNLGVWLSYPVTYGTATSCLFLYRRTFTRLFPPRLQRGTPYFITLNLGRQNEPKRSNADSEPSQQSPPANP